MWKAGVDYVFVLALPTLPLAARQYSVASCFLEDVIADLKMEFLRATTMDGENDLSAKDLRGYRLEGERRPLKVDRGLVELGMLLDRMVPVDEARRKVA